MSASETLAVVLRPIEASDAELVVGWRNEPAVRGNLMSQDLISVDDHMRWMEHQILTGKCIQFIICLEDGHSSTPIGTTFIKSIDGEKGCGEFGIFLGEEKARGKGYSHEAIRQILDHGFDSLGLSLIYLTVFADNIPGIRSYEKIGFVVDEERTELVERPRGDERLLYMHLSHDDYRKRQKSIDVAKCDFADGGE